MHPSVGAAVGGAVGGAATTNQAAKRNRRLNQAAAVTVGGKILTYSTCGLAGPRQFLETGRIRPFRMSLERREIKGAGLRRLLRSFALSSGVICSK